MPNRTSNRARTRSGTQPAQGGNRDSTRRTRASTNAPEHEPESEPQVPPIDHSATQRSMQSTFRANPAEQQPEAPPLVPAASLHPISEAQEENGQPGELDTPDGASSASPESVPASPTPQEQEEIEIPSFSTSRSSSPSSQSASPRRRSPTRSPVTEVPRAGPHSRNRFTRPQATPADKQKKALDVWTFFELSNGRRICNFCQKQRLTGLSVNIQSYSQNTGPSNLRTHLAEQHLADWVDACDEAKPSITITGTAAAEKADSYREKRDGFAGAGRTKAPKGAPQQRAFSQEAFIDALISWIVSDDQSLNVVENKYFRELCLLLREQLKDSDIPGRTDIRDRVIKAWEEHIKTLQTDVETYALGKVSATMDMWSDPNLTPYMAVTIHWMEGKTKQTPSGPQYEVRLRSDLAGFMRVPGNHDGEHLHAAFTYITDRIGVTELLGWVTMDNATNNDRFVRLMELAFARRERPIPFSAVERRIRCFPHIVNLACKAVIAAITDMEHAREPQNADEEAASMSEINGDAIATLRAFIRAVRVSSLRRQHFEAITQELYKESWELVRDCDTRWSSTFLMLDRALFLKDAINEMIRRYPREFYRYTLTEDDWESIMSIWVVPHAFQQTLSEEKQPSLGKALPAFEALKRQWEELSQTYPVLENIIRPGIDKLQDYRELADAVPAYVMSMILTPSERLRYYEDFDPTNLASMKQKFITMLQPYHEKIKERDASRRGPQPPHRSHSVPLGNHGTSSQSGPRRPSQFAGIYQSRSVSGSYSAANVLGLRSSRASANDQSLVDEVNAYLFDKSEGTDSVIYWQENQLRYPTLFLAAMDHLAIQGSAVPCERVFSSAKETMTARRNRISPELMEALQMLKYLINHSGRALNFTQGTSLEDEMENLIEMQWDDEVPRDPTDYSIMLAVRRSTIRS
ncbi:hypothetical protein NMY22_g13434 [Coprinellus aureogranulatus]|nr:hypothetical protein NMY22_g13434 [Coprinellus aureogranulatus]